MDRVASAYQALHLSRHDMAQDRLAPGGDNHVVRENAGWSRSPRAHGSLMLRVLRRIGQHRGRYDPSTVKRREESIHERYYSLIWCVHCACI